MKLVLKDFQVNATSDLYVRARASKAEAGDGINQALVLASPTGSGKTIIATSLMEQIARGDGEHEGDEEAVFLWLTDQPDLNEQSRRKLLAASSMFSSKELVTLDAGFDQDSFDSGKVYFLNIQKLSRGAQLVTAGDERQNTLWDTVTNMVYTKPGSFWLILDEAHKGMLTTKEAKEAATIVQKFVKGSDEIPAVPLIFGISATPERFVDVLKGTPRTLRQVVVEPDDVRASGLLKETITLFHPIEQEPSDWSLLLASAQKLKLYKKMWRSYCSKENEAQVEPVLVIQVEDGDNKVVSRTDLAEALNLLEQALGDLSNEEIAHCFQEGYPIDIGDRSVRYVSPADIQDDSLLRVVFFKLSLNTGWDCPRAEVIMSFRRALDYTRIAQLVGRLVRTPLARHIHGNDFLNSVALYLPHYDKKALSTVIDYLSKPDTGLAAPPDIVEGNELRDYSRNEDLVDLFAVAECLPTYGVERTSKISNVRRLIQLGRALAWDKLEPDSLQTCRAVVISTLNSERTRLMRTPAFKQALKETAQVDIRGVKTALGDDKTTEIEETFEEIELVAENIDDLYRQSGRKLGEGLHTEYLKTRIATGSAKALTAKLELHALMNDEKVVKKLEGVAGELIQKKFDQFQVAIQELPDARREQYRRLRRQAAQPEPENLELPEVYEATTGEQVFRKHLYVDKNGQFTCRLNEWETDVVEKELSRSEELVGWLRNMPRKAWAFGVPYNYRGEDRPMYPDFLFFRRQGAAVTVDILEPHSLSHDDSWAKAKGLADYANRHGDQFGRIELIIKEKGTLVRLDVNQVGIRDKVRAVSNNEHLRQLFF
jgi:type III restriction enzyme